MTITRMLCFAGTLALATPIGISASNYAAQPWVAWLHQTRESPKQNQNPPRRRILTTA